MPGAGAVHLIIFSRAAGWSWTVNVTPLPEAAEGWQPGSKGSINGSEQLQIGNHRTAESCKEFAPLH
jgi:hypothetical protein